MIKKCIISMQARIKQIADLLVPKVESGGAIFFRVPEK